MVRTDRLARRCRTYFVLCAWSHGTMCGECAVPRWPILATSSGADSMCTHRRRSCWDIRGNAEETSSIAPESTHPLASRHHNPVAGRSVSWLVNQSVSKSSITLAGSVVNCRGQRGFYTTYSLIVSLSGAHFFHFPLLSSALLFFVVFLFLVVKIGSME